jgi:transposase-like protein
MGVGGHGHRLIKDWQGEATAFGQRDLSGTDYLYVWVDAIHLKVLLAQDLAQDRCACW